jgi:hypothetical protein
MNLNFHSISFYDIIDILIFKFKDESIYLL